MVLWKVEEPPEDKNQELPVQHDKMEKFKSVSTRTLTRSSV